MYFSIFLGVTKSYNNSPTRKVRPFVEKILPESTSPSFQWGHAVSSLYFFQMARWMGKMMVNLANLFWFWGCCATKFDVLLQWENMPMTHFQKHPVVIQPDKQKHLFTRTLWVHNNQNQPTISRWFLYGPSHGLWFRRYDMDLSENRVP